MNDISKFKETKRSSELIFDGKVIHLHLDDILLPDGIGISLVRGICGARRTDRIAGIDAAWELLGFAQDNMLSVYLLGGKPGVAQNAAKNLKIHFPKLNVCGAHHGYFDKTTDSAQNRAVLSDIRRKCPDILFVCFGFPAQEEWIHRNSSSLPTVRIFMGLGGSLDVWAGNIPRAPRLMQRMGLEWLWRCVKEPKRFHDSVYLPLFLFKAIKNNTVRHS